MWCRVMFKCQAQEPDSLGQNPATSTNWEPGANLPNLLYFSFLIYKMKIISSSYLTGLLISNKLVNI